MNFQGEFHNSIDVKGRTSIPARFRESLDGDVMVVTKNLENGLTAYPLSRWSEMVARVHATPPGEKRTALQRLIINPAQECPIDKQGRVAIPHSLRQYAALEKDVVAVGNIDKIEIFNPVRYAEVCDGSSDCLRGDPQFMADLGF